MASFGAAPWRSGSTQGPYRSSGGSFPLSSQFEAGRRGLYDELSGSLADINAQRQQLPYRQNVYLNRLNQDAGQQVQRTNEGFSERGIFNSGLRQQQLGRDSLGFDRQRQDLGFGFADTLTGLARQESGAHRAYNSGLMDLMLQSAAAMGQDMSMPFYARGVA